MKCVDEPDRLVIAAGVVHRFFERVGAEKRDVARLWLQARGVSNEDNCTPFHWPMQLQPSTQSWRVI